MSYCVFLLFTLISIISSYVAPFVNPSLLINIEEMFLYFKMTGYKKSPQTILQITSILLQYRFKANFNVTSNKLQFTLKYRSIVPKGISFHSCPITAAASNTAANTKFHPVKYQKYFPFVPTFLFFSLSSA